MGNGYGQFKLEEKLIKYASYGKKLYEYIKINY